MILLTLTDDSIHQCDYYVVAYDTVITVTYSILILLKINEGRLEGIPSSEACPAAPGASQTATPLTGTAQRSWSMSKCATYWL